ncbi:hypothetical protein ACSLO7_30185, partial [Klebsiella pneumoniae]
PGIALFYGGLIRGKNVLSMLTQVIVTFGLVCVLWVIYGYTLAIASPGRRANAPRPDFIVAIFIVSFPITVWSGNYSAASSASP